MPKLLLIFLIAAAGTLPASAQAYLDPSLSPSERAADLLPRLSLDEKIDLMMDDSPAIPRLVIKRYNWWNEALHGIGRAGYATVFPQSIGMAAAFDDDLHYRIFSAISDEARAKFNTLGDEDVTRYKGLTFWTPNVNIFRDPRWGRGQETYGEDPYLSSVLGEAAVRGLQGPESSKYMKSIACAKHYAVHSGPEWNRHSFDARDIDPRDLWETYLPAFKTLVDAGVGQVMCAYNRVEGEPCCSNKRLLHEILRNKWGYDKIIVSDCWAIRDFYAPNAHATHSSAAEASADAVVSGTDLECGSSYKSLREAYDKGLISEEALDRSLMRLLEARFSLGEIGSSPDCEWNSLGASDICSADHKALALESARKSMTLLKNNGILPLPRNANIMVMGPNATDTIMQWGNYNGFPTRTIGILEGIKELAPQTRYLKGCDHVKNNNLRSQYSLLQSGDTPGVKVDYWSNSDWEGDPIATEILTSPTVKSNGGATVFAPGVPLENFSARYSAEFVAPETGEYFINIASDRGMKGLNINGERVLKSYGQNPTNEYFHPLQVKKGEKYEISVDYSHKSGPALMKFDLGRNEDYATDAGDCDVVVFVGGISAAFEGEEMPVSVEGFRGGDRTSIELPRIQRDLLRNLKNQGKKIVMVNCSGSAMGLSAEDSICDAILQAWYPGEAGGQAVAETLFGLNNPAGRLPITFYASDSQLPDFEDYAMEGRTYRYLTETPLYPFGHGLSFTEFTYSAPELPAAAKAGEEVALKVNVTNCGSRDGEEVVQVYVKNPKDPSLQKTLRSFKRIPLRAGETKTVEFSLSPSAFAFYSDAAEGLAVDPGRYEVLVGGSSDATQSRTISLK